MYKGRWAVILNGLVRMDFTEKVICEERFEAHERVNHVDTWTKNMLTGRNTQLRGSKSRMCLLGLRNSKEVRVAGLEG